MSSAAETPLLSLVVPAYNEAARLPVNLGRLAAYLDRTELALGRRRPAGADPADAPAPDPAPAWHPGRPDRGGADRGGAGGAGSEVLVIVEKSADETLALCRQAVAGRPEFRVVDNQVQRGKGYAVRSGVLRARGEIVLFMDADLSTPLEEIGRFLDHFAAHPEIDVLVGNRRHAASRIGLRQPFVRRRLSALFNAAVRWQGVSGIADTQCGFKAFRRRAAQEIFCRQRLDGFSFDLEILLLARSLGFRVSDLPVDWSDHPASTLRLLRDGWRMGRDLVRLRRLVARSLRERPYHRQTASDASAGTIAPEVTAKRDPVPPAPGSTGWPVP